MAQTPFSSEQRFRYEAYDAAGNIHKGRHAVITAPDLESATQALQSNGYVPMRVWKASRFSFDGDLKTMLTGGRLRLKPAQISELSRKLNSFIKAGVSWPRTLKTIAQDEKSDGLAAILEEVSAAIQSGVPVSEAFARYPDTFDDVFVGYLEAGESGDMLGALGRLQVLTAKRASLRAKIKGVTAYPKMVSYALFVMVVVILYVVLPKFEEMYVAYSVDLPASTLAVQALKRNLFPISIDFWNGLPVLWSIRPKIIWLFDVLPWPSSPLFWFPFLIWAARRWIRQNSKDERIGRRIDIIKFRMPVFGRMNHLTTLYRWISTYSSARQAGIGQVPALDLAAAASGSVWVGAITDKMNKALNAGTTLPEIMAEYPKLFPNFIRSMIAAGQETGDEYELLDGAAVAIDDEVDALMAGLSSKIEVVLLMVLSGVVLALLIVLYAPIMGLATKVLEANS